MYYGYKSDYVFDYVAEGRRYMYMAGILPMSIRRKTRNNQSINVSEDDHNVSLCKC